MDKNQIAAIFEEVAVLLALKMCIANA